MKKILSFFTALFFCSIPFVAQAQFTISPNLPTSFGISNTTKTLQQTIVSVVNWVLGLLGIIAVIMIIASVIIGATTSDSNREATAKKALISAIIGLIVVILAYAIVTFVVQATNNVTNS